MNEAEKTARAPDQDVLRTLGRTGVRPKWQRVLFRGGLLLALLAAALFGARRFLKQRAEAARPHYLTKPAERRGLDVTVGVTGTLEGLNTVEVGSEVSGKITELLVDFNDTVEVGQTLAVIDPEQSQAAVDEALASVTSSDAAVLEAQATLEEAKLNAERAEKQVAEGLISTQEFESLRAARLRAQAALSRARASATLARASLKSAKSRLTKTVIVSPIDGMVQSRLVELGQTLSAGMTTPVLFKLTEDLRQMRLSVAVDEADIGRMRAGQKATFTVDAYPEQVFESQVLSLRNEPTTDQNVVTYEGILAVNNEQRLLRPGMTATATVVTETKEDVLAVPNAALRFSMPETKASAGFGPPGRSARPRRDETVPGVWVLQGESAVRVAAKFGATDGQYSEVRESKELTVGSAVIVDVESTP